MGKSKHILGIILCTILTVVALVATFIPFFVQTKAKEDGVTEEASLTLNAAPELKKSAHGYIFTETGSSKHYLVYSDSILDEEAFKALASGETVQYRTFKDGKVGIKTIANLGDVTLVVSLKAGETEFVTLDSFNKALSNDLMWVQIICGCVAGLFLILDIVFIALHIKNKR